MDATKAPRRRKRRLTQQRAALADDAALCDEVDRFTHEFLTVLVSESLPETYAVPCPAERCWFDCGNLPEDRAPVPYPIGRHVRNEAATGEASTPRSRVVHFTCIGKFCSWPCVVSYNALRPVYAQSREMQLVAELIALVETRLRPSPETPAGATHRRAYARQLMSALDAGLLPKALPREMLTFFGGSVSLGNYRIYCDRVWKRFLAERVHIVVSMNANDSMILPVNHTADWFVRNLDSILVKLDGLTRTAQVDTDFAVLTSFRNRCGVPSVRMLSNQLPPSSGKSAPSSGAPPSPTLCPIFPIV